MLHHFGCSQNRCFSNFYTKSKIRLTMFSNLEIYCLQPTPSTPVCSGLPQVLKKNIYALYFFNVNILQATILLLMVDSDILCVAHCFWTVFDALRTEVMSLERTFPVRTRANKYSIRRNMMALNKS